MEKFISVPVTGQPNQLISVTDVVLVSSSSATSTQTTIYYKGNVILSITHAAQVGYDMRTAILDAINNALATSWTNVVYVAQVPRAVSSISVGAPA